jgi:CubicO group peptidase (beta-lactamase class C family)
MLFAGALTVLLAIGVSAARAQSPNVLAFERRVEADRNALKIPGLSIIVIQDGEVLSARGFGYADIERRIAATPDTLYHIASVTKTFTATLVLRLAEQGKLDLDEPVSRYSDDFKDDSAKIKHLLSHTSEGTPGEKVQLQPRSVRVPEGDPRGEDRQAVASAVRGDIPRPARDA